MGSQEAPPANAPPRQAAAILSVAGSDPSGGAGIQADLKTFAVLGVYGAAAVTCLTVQNTREVRTVQPLAPSLVREQIALVLADLPVSHIKIGMVGTAEIAAAIGAALDGFAGEVVYDPVLRATAGRDLFEPAALEQLQQEVVARATVLTPNVPELEELSGVSCPDPGAVLEAGGLLLANNPGLRALVVKGGHFPSADEQVTDFLLLPASGQSPMVQTAAHPRLATRNSHGTGCTFASAFAAFHQQSGSYRTAFEQTVDFLHCLLTRSAGVSFGRGNGPLQHHLCRR